MDLPLYIVPSPPPPLSRRTLTTRTGHIEWHLQAGLAVTFIEAPLEAQQRNSIPQFMYDQCAAQNMPTVGNAAGHTDPDDLSGLPEGPFPQKLGWHSKGIGAMAGCVLTAVLGMATVTWYALGGHISDEEMEHEVRREITEKERRRDRIKRMVWRQRS